VSEERKTPRIRESDEADKLGYLMAASSAPGKSKIFAIGHLISITEKGIKKIVGSPIESV
jgi:hypothetical protein